MTLILAISCSDGVVMAGESAASDTETGTKQRARKVRQLGEQPILYGGSGDVGLLQRLDECLRGFSNKPSLKRIRQDLRKAVVPELAEARELHVPFPQQPFHQPPTAVMLFAGIHDERPWIIEIERDGRDTAYGEELGGFAAIGSGKPWAQALFRPHLGTTRTLELGRLFACRVMEDAIELAAGFIAPPIYIMTVDKSGSVSEVDATTLTGVSETCELWRALERETVGRILTPPAASPAPPEEIPKP